MSFSKILGKLSKFVSHIRLPYVRKKVTQAQIKKVISTCRPGDLVLTHVDGELSSLFLDHWSHAGILDMGLVYDASTTGVDSNWTAFFLARKDDFKILRPKFQFDTKELLDFLERNKDIVQLMVHIKAVPVRQVGHIQIYKFYKSLKNKEKMVNYSETAERFGIEFRQVINIINDLEQPI